MHWLTHIPPLVETILVQTIPLPNALRHAAQLALLGRPEPPPARQPARITYYVSSRRETRRAA